MIGASESELGASGEFALRHGDASEKQQDDLQGRLVVSGGDKCPTQKLPEADPELVGQLRQALRCAHKQHGASYSRRHYLELMDESSPNAAWRYLLQCEGHLEEALALAQGALVWRKANAPHRLQASAMLKDLWLRTPIGFVGRTRAGHELMYAVGKCFRRPEEPVRQMIKDFMTLVLFQWEQRHLHDLEQVVLVMDVTGTSFSNIDLDMASWFLSKVDLVPARIRAIHFVGIPLLLRPIFRLVLNVLPARFRRVVDCGSFAELVRPNVDDHSLPEEIGGRADNKWRLAPASARWAHELLADEAEANQILAKLDYAFSFGITREHLDKIYRMQADYERDPLKG